MHRNSRLTAHVLAASLNTVTFEVNLSFKFNPEKEPFWGHFARAMV